MLDLLEHGPVSPTQILTRPRHVRLIGKYVGRLMALGYRLTGKDRYDNYILERVSGVPILVMPSVCNPKSMRTGAFLASLLDGNLVAADAEVLDMGTGSGICAIFAARRARRVVAVDINPAAVRCARLNASLSDVEDKIEVRHGDLFSAVAGERFDLIAFNPPFLRGVPRNDRERAWRSSDVAERFAADLRVHLKPSGFALLLLSTFGDAAGFLAKFDPDEFAISVLAERHFINERLAVFRITPRYSRCSP